MAEDLKGYTAFITGGSAGLGFEMAKQLLSQGACAIIGARSENRLLEARKALGKIGEVYAIQLDVTN